MANPVAIYTPDPSAPTRRGGSSASQLIQLDPYRSGGRGRSANSDSSSSSDNVRVDGRGESARVYEYEAVRRGTRRARYSDSFTTDDRAQTTDDRIFEAGRRRAPASLTFAAQQIAQEGLSPGLYFENYGPAINAYTAAATRGTTSAPRNGQSVEIYA
jgi:hypothetical protein